MCNKFKSGFQYARKRSYIFNSIDLIDIEPIRIILNPCETACEAVLDFVILKCWNNFSQYVQRMMEAQRVYTTLLPFNSVLVNFICQRHGVHTV